LIKQNQELLWKLNNTEKERKQKTKEALEKLEKVWSIQ